MARILVADDDPDIRQLVIYSLLDEGHDVEVASNGQEAIDQVVASPPELMVLDIMMPEVDGFSVLRELGTRGLLVETRVLVLTAEGSERDWKEAFDLGADRYMTKPFDPDEIVRTIAEMLSATPLEIAARRAEEQNRADLLSQLESIFGDV